MSKNKELVLALVDAEQAAVVAIKDIMQQYSLPCYLMEPIVDKIHRQILDGKTSEIVAAKTREYKEGAKADADHE